MTNKTKVIRRYTERYKQQVVCEVLSGQISKSCVARKYGIKGSNTVDRWCRKYGGDSYKRGLYIDLPLKVQKHKVMTTKKAEPLPDDPKVLKQRIAQLETQLRAAQLKREAFERAIEIAKRDLGIDVLKKCVTKQSPK
jgi:transposase-like protein